MDKFCNGIRVYVYILVSDKEQWLIMMYILFEIRNSYSTTIFSTYVFYFNLRFIISDVARSFFF